MLIQYLLQPPKQVCRTMDFAKSTSFIWHRLICKPDYKVSTTCASLSQNARLLIVLQLYRQSIHFNYGRVFHCIGISPCVYPASNMCFLSILYSARVILLAFLCEQSYLFFKLIISYLSFIIVESKVWDCVRKCQFQKVVSHIL